MRTECIYMSCNYHLTSLSVFTVFQPYCSLHLHLQVSDNPYASGNIASKESAPGIIVASGTELSVSFNKTDEIVGGKGRNVVLHIKALEDETCTYHFVIMVF